MRRMTFVGIFKCGHTGYLARDPATYARSLKAELVAETYKSLVDDLRYYAQHGTIKLVGDDELKPYTDSFATCRCKPDDALDGGGL